MHNRPIASWLRRVGAVALPVAVAALGSAGPASATAASVVYTPTTTAQLVSDVSAADGQPAGTLSIIQLGPYDYSPTATLTLSGNIEITGPPTQQSYYGTNGQDPLVDGTQIPVATPQDLFAVSSGANVLFKAFDIGTGGVAGTSFAGVDVKAGATAELDNMGLIGSQGPAVNVASGTPGGTVTIRSSYIADASGLAVSSTSGNTTWLINDTIAGLANGALAGAKFGAINTLLVNNTSTSGQECSNPFVSASNVLSDDSSCGTSGVTVTTATAVNLAGTGFYGGPTETNQLGAGSIAIGAANPAYCATADQRFYPRTAGTCDIGAYQTTADTNEGGLGVPPKQTTGPTCTVASVNQTSNPQTMTVNAQDSGVGLGTDAISYFAPSGSTYPVPTNNGTVSYPTVGSTWFASTFPSAPSAQETDFPSTSPFPVTATKPTGDATLNDTKWSFDATNWLGITTYCK